MVAPVDMKQLIPLFVQEWSVGAAFGRLVAIMPPYLAITEAERCACAVA